MKILKFSHYPRIRQSLEAPVPDLALADNVFNIQSGRHKTQDMIDKDKFIFYSYFTGFMALPMKRYRSKAGYSLAKVSAVPLLGFTTFSQKYSQHSVIRLVVYSPQQLDRLGL